VRTPSVGLIIALFVTAVAHGQTPVPDVTGPIPVTATSYPFLAADKLAEPMDLTRVGYVEEEFFVSGTANVYDWPAAGELTVVKTGAPYTNRILVRRPADPARFSGTVIVEMMHAPRGVDFPLMWAWIHEHVVERGHAWVGLTMHPDAVKALKRFNATRYAQLAWANPNPAESCASGGRGAGPAVSDSEEGLLWDITSQLGALLKSSSPSRPLATLKVEYVYLTTQDAAQLTYINAMQRRAMLANGKPVYDGHLTKSARRASRIRRCAPAPPEGDARHRVKDTGVPVINVLLENNVLGALRDRREDSDAPADRFRLYEVPGTAHSGAPAYRWATATMADHEAAGGEVVARKFSAAIAPFTLEVPLRDPQRCQPSEMISEQPAMTYTFHAAFANLDAWVRKGTPAPRAGRIEVVGEGRQAQIARDRFGNALGGLRTPYVEVPTATFHSEHGTGPGCGGNFGYAERFHWAQLDALYGSYANYVSRMSQAVDRAVKDRSLTESDGRKIKAELTAAMKTPGAAARN
jgi:Alpha/beta hydrolase domain